MLYVVAYWFTGEPTTYEFNSEKEAVEFIQEQPVGYFREFQVFENSKLRIFDEFGIET